MKQTVVMINLPELSEEINFRRAIESPGAYQSYEEYMDDTTPSPNGIEKKSHPFSLTQRERNQRGKV